MRLGVGALFVAGVAGFALWLGGDNKGKEGAGKKDPGQRTWQSSYDCKSCHEEVWNEWWGSQHQIAYLNPEVRKLSDDFRNKECQACHLPKPISLTGYGQRVLPRMTRPNEGVGCLTCHLGKNGEILGRNSKPNAPCAPVASKDVVSVELCASCHNQHKTTDQWRESHYPKEGKGCNECHMEPVLRKGGLSGRGHRYPAAHDKAMLRRAGKFEVSRDEQEIVFALTNVGAGHNFPTEERHRCVDIEYRFVVGDKVPEKWTRSFRFRQPYRDEPGENTQLPAGETKRLRAKIPEGATRVEARLWYRRTPYVDDKDPRSILLEERRIDLE